MKRFLPLLLILCLLLSACNAEPEQTEVTTEPSAATTQPAGTTAPPETTAPATEAATEPSTEPTEEILYNPLTGEALDEPYTGRVIAATIDNVPSALPHRGVSQADMFFEMFVNDYCTRGLALFSNAGEVESIGPIRSGRYNFVHVVKGYDAILNYASAGETVLKYIASSGIDHISVDEANFAYRDNNRFKEQGYNWEHTMFAKGQSLLDGAKKRGYDTEMTGLNFGMTFAEDGTPANGQTASNVEIIFTHKGRTKDTVMKYDTETGKYVFWQYGKEQVDENNGEPEAFRNVIVMLVPVENDGKYHVANLIGSGDGYFACGGKAIPIKWSHESEDANYSFTLADGTPLTLGIGSSYVGLVPTGSPVNFS